MIVLQVLEKLNAFEKISLEKRCVGIRFSLALCMLGCFANFSMIHHKTGSSGTGLIHALKHTDADTDSQQQHLR